MNNITASSAEQSLRRRLDIPDDTARALILAESSHWDPNWLYTSEEYFRRWVRRNLDQAVDGLLRQPRRIYSVECMFFLRMYWEARPERQEKVRALVNERRLRLTSSGVTTADTLVPRPEAILRDWLAGQEWLRANGMSQEPRLAYFTDSFGSSPALPSLLRAAGFDLAAITRVDGMYFGFADYESGKHFPRPGSSAELLERELRTSDFIWRGPDGAEVLCHWNAFGYGQGDMMAHRGLARVYLAPFAVSSRGERAVAQRIDRIAAQLAPLSRTPYLFCPIGFDFVPPIPDLLPLLDRYNRHRYPTTGTWVVNAGLDDYLSLVECHRDELPTLELDPNPYWTGYYSARPTLKQLAHEAADALLLAEHLALAPGNESAARSIGEELAGPWWDVATANHHDFITGTSPDKVVESDQRPRLERALKAAELAIARLTPATQPAPERQARPEWRHEAGKVEVRTPHYTVVVAEEAGGAIVDAWDGDRKTHLLTGASADLVSHRDAGGLWRMGHEYRGGHFVEHARASDRPASVTVHDLAGGLEVACSVELEGETVRRRLWFRGDSPIIRLRVEGRAAARRTVTLRFATTIAPGVLAMDVPGGVVLRPLEKLYHPTFWPLQRFVHAQDQATDHGVALALRLPGAVAFQPDGRLEAVGLRNATRELAWGLLPIPATPATGHERRPYAFECALWFTAGGDWQANDVARLAAGLAESPWEAPATAGLRALARSLATVDRPDVAVIALKPASRGVGLIARLYTLSAAGSAVLLTLPGRRVRAAFLCDSRERDVEPLEVAGGAVRLALPGNITSVRLVV